MNFLFTKGTLKNYGVPLLTFLIFTFHSFAQQPTVAQQKILNQAPFFNNAQPADPLSKLDGIPVSERASIEAGIDPDKALYFSLNTDVLSNLVREKSDKLVLRIPFEGNSTLELQLIESEVFTDEFQVFTSSDRNNPVQYNKGVYYWGMVINDPNSMVALSLFEDQITATISAYGRSFDLGKIHNSTAGTHILYENKDIKKQFDLDCGVEDVEIHSHDDGQDNPKSEVKNVGGNCVRMYLETDYSMYQYYGSVSAVVNYVTGAFNQVILLYANESIDMTINELIVWDVVDPYTGTSTSTALTQFRNYLNGNYNGDLAHLIGRSTEFSGGIAYVDVVCNSYYGVGVSGINSSYQNIPTYSWTVMVLAHEIGHNLGSPHTHSCSWNGNGTAIDDCGNVYYISNGYDDNGDGIVDNLADAQYYSPCFDNVNNLIPAGGGTIMSYCHLNNVGINLNLGFGQQPGDLIRNRVSNASCLTACNTGPLAVAITASSDVSCGGVDDGSATAEASGGTGNYSYSWSNGATTATISNLPAGTYTVTVNDGNETVMDSVTILDNNSTYYADLDGDGYGDPQNTILDCSPPTNYVTDNSDCDDSDNTVYPNAPELCDGIDNNCSGGIDEGLTFSTYYADTDNDNYGDPNNTVSACSAPAGYVSNNTDCDDSNPNINPGMTELCDGIDNNCNGTIDEGVTNSTFYADADGDGYGDPNVSVEDCAAPSGYVADNTDCDDTNASIYPGGTCDDGDACTINDVYDSNCGCSGTLTTDSDGDGVCDALDVCDGGDDTLDTDNDGIPDDCDCNDSVGNFAGNGLSHSGNGSSSNSLSFSAGSRDASFTISEINQRTGGKPANRYIELVTVDYIDGNGVLNTWGQFSGDSTSSLTVTISGEIQQITVTLEDIYDGSTNGNMNISLGDVTYCAPWDGTGCTDSDGDGVCDENDICPGGDDTVDTDGDGIPDYCDTSCDTTGTEQFTINPLTHSGPGSNSTSLNFAPGTSDISFTISDFDQKTNGKPSTRYSERVAVSYVDGTGSNQSYGTFEGTTPVDISISGLVQSVTLVLDDSYGGGTGTQLSVSMSEVTTCIDGVSATALTDSIPGQTNDLIKLYPNPASTDVYVRFNSTVENGTIKIHNLLGKEVKSIEFKDEHHFKLDINGLTGGNLYFVTFEIPGRSTVTRKLILLD